MIFDIQRYSIHDGEGIRTMVFYKGCPLHCPWCSNPESQTYGLSLWYDQDVCRKFGDCVNLGNPGIALEGGTLKINTDLLTNPENLREVCASKALTLAGTELRPEEIMAEIEKDLPFYLNSKGGVTLSGGEPLSQDGAVLDLIHLIKRKNIHLAVETSLHVPWVNIERCIGLVDTFLIDLKHMNPVVFRHFTGGDLYLVLDNLKKLDDYRGNIIIRIPVIPDFNHNMSDMIDLIDHAIAHKRVDEIHFIPYHTLGIKKYRMLGRDYPYKGYPNLPVTALLPYIEYARTKEVKYKIGG